MAKMVYDEWYGDLSYAQRAAYRKHNVPPAMHTDLEARFGPSSENHAAITAFVKDTVSKHGRIDYSHVSTEGMFNDRRADDDGGTSWGRVR